jgi:hypothetical protein
MESHLNCLPQLLATELVHMPLVKRQAKQIELTIFVNLKLHELSGLCLDFPPRHKFDYEHQLNDIMRAQCAVSLG